MKPGNMHSRLRYLQYVDLDCRQEIRAMTGAGDGDSVLFVGSGSTAAVELLIHLMQPEKLV